MQASGPYGCLITRAIREKHTYKDYIGVDACAANLMRPAIYGAYHHITGLGKEAAERDHTYFNLSGHDCGTVRNHLVQITADTYLPLREDCVSQGVIAPVAKTPFDFKSPSLQKLQRFVDNSQMFVSFFIRRAV